MFVKPDKNKILKLAKNLKLELNESELKEIDAHFDRIIPKFNKLAEIDTNGVDVLDFNNNYSASLREDKPGSNDIELEERNIKIVK
ncbi:MAG: hypothetical protein LBV53_01350 [Mycoplasmataceae bacterium]|jgi:aspartyl/glutamyl-tRNA(Asn/Gln) amidotransferase C subunit|nr:hypothetical protein [Mycoplasmataceae bacterium]